MSDSKADPAVSRETAALAKASYERCCTRAEFIPSFYRTFFTNCPAAEPKFATTDFERQNRLLRHAIGLLLIFPLQPDDEPSLLTRIAERHSSRDLDIDPSLYPSFIDSLIHTVREHDPQFTTEIERAWRATVAKGVAYMQSRY